MYRIYGSKQGYELIDVVNNEEEIEPYLNNTEYNKILVIEHNNDSDFPYALVYPKEEKNKVKKKKYISYRSDK